jgi:hypothetical protein
MATITVNGSVERVFHNGAGATVIEPFTTKDGKERNNRYTVWFQEAHGLTIGEVVEISGLHSVVVEEWTGDDGVVRHSAKVNINFPQVKKAAGNLVAETFEDAPF